jgi:hypothetical protein
VSKVLAGVRFRPHRVSLAGALGGLLEAAGRDLPQTYLVGATGHAFRLTLDVVISPGSPTELNFHDLFPLWENLGAWFKRTTARLDDPDFGDTRAECLSRVREAIDRGLPAMLFDVLQMPEYGLVVGYEGDRLACLTIDNPEVPRWMEAAEWPPEAHRAFTRADVIELLDLAPSFDRRRAEVASLRFAVQHFWEPPSRDMWLQHGLKAWEFWIGVLRSSLPLHGPEPGLGHSYNLVVLHRARRDAAAYLSELAAKYGEAPSLQAAADRYGEVATLLAEATRALPFPGQNLAQAETRKALEELLRRAMAAERQGVEEIERSLRALR